MNMEVRLYKYTKHIAEFIKKPVLKNTLFSELNDPFEIRLSATQLKQINDRPPLMGDNYKLGVIALTSNPKNLQMWSHYADDHKGGLIEFTFEIDGPDFWFDQMTNDCEGYLDSTSLFQSISL